MSNNSSGKKKKVVVSTSRSSGKRKARVRRSRQATPAEVLLFGKKHFILMGVGVGLILLGLVLMSGGGPESYDTWDPDSIYSFRRTVLAPAFMIAGFIVQIFMIFKK